MSEDPFGFLAPSLRPLPSGEAERQLEAMRPLDMYHPLPDPPLRLRHLTSMRCEKYARLLHPLEVIKVVDGEGFVASSDWSKLGHVDPDVSLRAFLREAQDSVATRGLEVNAMVGSLEQTTARDLATLIRETFPTKECFFHFWGGEGFFPVGGPFVYQGRIELVACLFPHANEPFQSPTLWWEKDSWFVATHTDSTSSYVGGTSQLIEAILRSPGLEALPADLDTVVDDWTAGRD
jgi:hypothetical protein